MGMQILGQAGVRLVAEGEGFAESAREALNGSAGSFADAGRDAGGRFADGAEGEVRRKGGRLRGVVGGLGKAIAGGLVAGMAVVGAGAITGFFGEAITAASDLSEVSNAVQQTFGSATASIQTFANDAAATLGQTSLQAQQAAVTFGTFGKAAGLTGPALGKFSTDLVGLSTDLASFHNTSPEEAIDAVGAALRGESEPIRRYGVLLDDATLRQEALALGLTKTTKSALTPQQKVLAAQAAIFKQTQSAQGDFARTSGGLANQQRILSAQWTTMKARLGQGLLPIMTRFVSAANGALPVLSDLAGRVGGALGAALKVIGPPLAAAGSGIRDFVTGLGMGSDAVSDASGPLTGLVAVGQKVRAALLPALSGIRDFIAGFTLDDAGVADIGAPLEGLVDVGHRVRDAFVGLYDLFVKGNFSAALADAFNVDADSPIVGQLLWIRDGFLSLVNVISTQVIPWVMQFYGQMIAAVGPGLSAVFSGVMTLVSAVIPIVQQVVAVIVQNWPAISATIRETMDAVVSITKASFSIIGSLFRILAVVVTAIWNSAFGQSLLRIVKVAIPAIIAVIRPIIQIIVGIFQALAALLKGDWSGLWDAVKKILKGAWDGIIAILKGVGKLVVAALQGVWDTALWSVKSALGKWKDIGTWIIDGIVEGLRKAAHKVGDTAKDAVQGGLDKVKDAFKINSPSKVWADVVGVAIPEGIAKGIDGKSHLIADSASSAVLDAMNSVELPTVDAAMRVAAGSAPAATARAVAGRTQIVHLSTRVTAPEVVPYLRAAADADVALYGLEG